MIDFALQHCEADLIFLIIVLSMTAVRDSYAFLVTFGEVLIVGASWNLLASSFPKMEKLTFWALRNCFAFLFVDVEIIAIITDSSNFTFLCFQAKVVIFTAFSVSNA